MNLRIETLRGLACLLLVSYHVIGADPGLGLRVGDGPLRWLNDGLAYLRMPLFTFLSGLVYGYRPFEGNSHAFLSGKARRLLIPMLFVGTLFALLQGWVPGINRSPGPWHLWHLKPVAHFWFVESLFWVFVLIWALERWGGLKRAPQFVLVLALACALYLAVRGWPWLGFDGAIYLLPYFLGGLACSRFPVQSLLRSPWLKLYMTALAITLVGLQGMPVPNPDRRTALMLTTGMTLCLLSLSLALVSPWLARIGRYSYSIFIFHVFFTASARIGLDLLGLDHTAVDLVLGIALGVLGPILLERIISPLRWPSLLLLGQPIAIAPRQARPQVNNAFTQRTRMHP